MVSLWTDFYTNQMLVMLKINTFLILNSSMCSFQFILPTSVIFNSLHVREMKIQCSTLYVKKLDYHEKVQFIFMSIILESETRVTSITQ